MHFSFVIYLVHVFHKTQCCLHYLCVCQIRRPWSFTHVYTVFLSVNLSLGLFWRCSYTVYVCLSVLGRLHVSRQFTLSCLSVSLSVFGRLHMFLSSLLCIVAFLTVYQFLVFNITSWVVPADISSKWLYQTFWRQHVFCCFFYLYGRRYIADIPPSPGCLTF